MEVEELGYTSRPMARRRSTASPFSPSGPFEVIRGLPGDENEPQSRYIEAVLPTGKGACGSPSIYLPNGNPALARNIPTSSAFMDRLDRPCTALLLAYEEPLVLAGDFNVIPEPRDAADPDLGQPTRCSCPQTRSKFRELLALGLTDALRATTDAGGLYTFWDYQAGAWQSNNGIRIDHLLLSPQAADRLESVAIDKECARATRRPTTRLFGSNSRCDRQVLRPAARPGLYGVSDDRAQTLRSHREDGPRHRLVRRPWPRDGAGSRGSGRGDRS